MPTSHPHDRQRHDIQQPLVIRTPLLQPTAVSAATSQILHTIEEAEQQILHLWKRPLLLQNSKDVWSVKLLPVFLEDM